MTPRFLRWSTVHPLVITLLQWSSREAGICAAPQQIAVGVTVGFSSQQPGDSDRPYLGPGFGGTSVGGVLFIDADVVSRVGLGGEVSLGADIKARQQQRASGGRSELRSRHHDTIFAGVVKFKALTMERADVAAVLGAGLGWRHTIRVGTFRSDLPPFSTMPVEQVLSNAVFTTTFGFDGAISVSPRAALVWTGRFHVLHDDDREPSGVVRRGVASAIFRFGGGARYRF